LRRWRVRRSTAILDWLGRLSRFAPDEVVHCLPLLTPERSLPEWAQMTGPFAGNRELSVSFVRHIS
jgi:hypothetical protein